MNELDNVTPQDGATIRQEAAAAPVASAAEESHTCETPVEETSEATPKEVHRLTKPEMAARLREIIASGNLEAHKEVASIKQAYYLLLNRESMELLAEFTAQGNDPAEFSAPADPEEAQIKQLLAEFRDRRAEYLDARDRELRSNLEKKNETVAKLKAIADDIDSVNVRFQEFQQLQQEFKAIGDVPPGNDNEIWKNYQNAVEVFYDRLKMNKELRDLDFKKNLEIKLQLVDKARALTQAEDPVEAFRKLQDLHLQWRETGPVAKEMRDQIWNDFKEASTTVNKRHQDHFQERKAEEAANEEKKTQLCLAVEAIDPETIRTFADWDKASQNVMALQAEYKAAGFAPRKTNSALFTRFRKACDNFFTAKSEYFKKTKDELKDNYIKKEELCVKAEALVERAQEKKAFEELQALQQEWRTVGSVRRKVADEIWKRFCNAVDAFHGARKKHFGEQRSAETENLRKKQAIIASLKEISSDAERRDVIATIRDLQQQWQDTGFVPFKHKEAVNTEYRAELDRLFQGFNAKEKGQRMKRFEGEVKKMKGDQNTMGRERERLLRAIESRESEIKTIENNIGFFSIKSSAGNSLLKDFERKIEKLREDIAQLREKTALLDKQDKTEPEKP